jgi:predicted aldo/keto reductase-like oxidoreductase
MDHQSCEVSRRDLLRTGATIAATAGLSAVPAFAADKKDGAQPALPMRVLGKRTGTKVSMLNQGTAMKMSNRLLNTTWAEGIRYFDTADCYEGGNSEKFIATWLEKTGRRKDVFLVTKDHPKTPEQWVEMVDKRLEALKVDQIDLFFLHGLGDDEPGNDPETDIPKSKEWADAADKMKKAGKIKFAGFSTHCQPLEHRTRLMNMAAEGWPDAIMVAQTPSLLRQDAEFNKSLDKCYEAGIGLISMKEMRGAEQIKEVVPEFEEMGLTPHAAVLSATWTDERFASVCSHMVNVKLVRENAGTCRTFKPLPKDKVARIIDIVDEHNRAFCHGCTGNCCEAAGKKVAFSDIARYLHYYEVDGDRETARRLFRALPRELRDWNGADLKAASNACASKLPFEELLQRAQDKLA